MNKIILFVFAVCAAAWSYGNEEPATTPSGGATAIVCTNAAIFWFPVENADRIWSWGEGFPSQREYAWLVEVSLMEQKFEFGYTKWNPPPDKQANSKGSGSLQELLRRGQVNIWKNGRYVKGAHGISAARKGEGVAIRLTEPEFLKALLGEKPKQVVLESVGSASGRTKETVEVSYQRDSASVPKLSPEAEALVADYMQKAENKVFVIAIDTDRRFAYGSAFGKESLMDAAKEAVNHCDKERNEKDIVMQPIIYAMNNKVVYEEMYEKTRPNIEKSEGALHENN